MHVAIPFDTPAQGYAALIAGHRIHRDGLFRGPDNEPIVPNPTCLTNFATSKVGRILGSDGWKMYGSVLIWAAAISNFATPDLSSTLPLAATAFGVAAASTAVSALREASKVSASTRSIATNVCGSITRTAAGPLYVAAYIVGRDIEEHFPNIIF